MARSKHLETKGAAKEVRAHHAMLQAAARVAAGAQAAVRRSQRRRHFGKSDGATRGDVAVVMGPQGLVKVRSAR